MAHLSWEEVQRPSRDDMRCFLCLSVHRSNQRITSLTLSSNSWSTEEKKTLVLGLSLKLFRDISLAKTTVFAIYYTKYN